MPTSEKNAFEFAVICWFLFLRNFDILFAYGWQVFLSIEVQNERMLYVWKSGWYLSYYLLYIYVCLYSTVPDEEDLNISFVGKTTLRFGPAEQISFFRTHPEPGGYPYYTYYPSYISCTVDRTEANEENCLQHVSITEEITANSYYEWKLDA